MQHTKLRRQRFKLLGDRLGLDNTALVAVAAEPRQFVVGDALRLAPDRITNFIDIFLHFTEIRLGLLVVERLQFNVGLGVGFHVGQRARQWQSVPVAVVGHKLLQGRD